jgi:hypothetical protein
MPRDGAEDAVQRANAKSAVRWDRDTMREWRLRLKYDMIADLIHLHVVPLLAQCAG